MRLTTFVIVVLASSLCLAQDAGDFKPATSNVLDAPYPRVDSNSRVAAPLYPIGADQPKINAGSPTYPLDISGAISSDGRSLTVAVINPTESAQALGLDFKGIKLGSKRRLWRMAGPTVTASSGLNRNEVQVTETAVPAANAFEIAPVSISLYEFEKQ